FLVFVIVLGLVMLVVGLLHRLWPRTALIEPETAAPFWSPPDRSRAGGVIKPVTVTVAVWVLAAGTVGATRHFDQLPVRSDTGVYLTADGINPVPLPPFVGVDWIGRSAAVTAIEREILPPDTGYSRRNYVAL